MNPHEVIDRTTSSRTIFLVLVLTWGVHYPRSISQHRKKMTYNRREDHRDRYDIVYDISLSITIACEDRDDVT